MPLAVAITGTRATGHHDLTWYGEQFATYLAPFASADTRFYIGGAVGIDSLSLVWLAGNSPAEIIVVVPSVLDRQPAIAHQAISRCRDRIAEVVELGAIELSAPAYHARNRWMVDHAAMTIGFPREGTAASGTWQTLAYTATQGKPRLIVPV